ncbi:MAG: tetratricopeptide repeat protein [Gemmataceae bacterium]|nr:tetratricopeptide repeat protein [Gemmataceae bacterium]
MSASKRLLALAVLSLAGVVFYLYSRPPKADPDEDLARGQQAVRRHDVPEAQRIVRLLLDNGHPAHAALLRGEVYYRGKQFDQAEEQLARVDGESPLFPQAATFFGLCRLQRYDLRLAEQLFRRVLEVQPDAVEAHRGLADVYFALGAMSRAQEEMETVARLDPADARPWFFMGSFYSDVGLRAEAVKAYENALARATGPDAAARARFGLAESLTKFGDHTRALQVLAELPPDQAAAPEATVLRAEGLARQGKPAEAELLLAPLLDEARPPPAALTVAGRVAFDAGMYDRAAGRLDRAVRLDPANYDANYLLAQTYTRLGRAADAARQQTRADQVRNDLRQMSLLTDQAGARPWDAAVRDRLAEITRRLGKSEIAEKWERAAKACPPR